MAVGLRKDLGGRNLSIEGSLPVLNVTTVLREWPSSCLVGAGWDIQDGGATEGLPGASMETRKGGTRARPVGSSLWSLVSTCLSLEELVQSSSDGLLGWL